MGEMKGKPGTADVAPSEAWTEFAAGHGGHRFLACDPLYSMSAALIDALVAEVPGLLSDEDELFERDLAEANTFGFFRRQPVGYSAEEWANRPAEGELPFERTSTFFKALEIGREMTDVQTREYLKAYRDRMARIAAAASSYRGWLVSNKHFEFDLRFLKRATGRSVDRLGTFPRLDLKYYTTDHDRADGWSTRNLKQFRDFYRKWGLATLATWDWPIPGEPVVDGPVRLQPAEVAGAGLLLLIPWYMLRGGKFDLQDIVGQVRLKSYPAHLSDWLERPKRKGKDTFGDIRLSKISRIYHWHHLILMRRYPDLGTGRLEKLETAYSTVMKSGSQLVRMIRLELARNRKLADEFSAKYGL